MSTPEKLTDLKGTAEYAVEVGWSDEVTQPGRAKTDLVTRYKYLNQLMELPPDPPEFPEDEPFPDAPAVTIDTYYNEEKYDALGKPGSPEQLKEVLDALLEISNEGEATTPMVQQIDRLILTFRMVGIINSVLAPVEQVPEDIPSNANLPIIIPAKPPEVVLNTLSPLQFDTALQRWRDLPESDKVMRETIHAGVGARISNLEEALQFNKSSLQHLIRFEYVIRGNEVMYNALAGLHDSMQLVEESMGLLNEVGDILNQKDPEKAEVDLLALVGLNRNAPGYRVDLKTGKGLPSRDPKSYAAQLDAWENRQFNRELGRTVLDIGDDSTGFIRRLNERNSIESVYLPGLDNGGKTGILDDSGEPGSFVDTFAGIVENQPLVPGTLEIKVGEDGLEVFRDNDGDGVLTSNFGGQGTIDYVTGEWAVTFANPPRVPGRTLTIEYKYPRPIQEGPLAAEPPFGDGSNTSFSGTVDITPPLLGKFTLTDGREFIRDGGVADASNNGELLDSLGNVVGTINYDTGVWSATFPTAPIEDVPVEFSYQHHFFPRNGFQIGAGDHLTTEFPVPIPAPPDLDEDYFSQNIHPYPIRPGSVLVNAINTIGEAVQLVDDGAGGLSAPDGSTGTIDYITGEIHVTFIDPPAFGTEITVDFLEDPGFLTNSLTPIVPTLPQDEITINLGTTDGTTQIYEGQLDIFPLDPTTFNIQVGPDLPLIDRGNGKISGDPKQVILDEVFFVVDLANVGANYGGTLYGAPIEPGTLLIEGLADNATATDDGAGNIIGPNISGTIDYETGEWVLNFPNSVHDNRQPLFNWETTDRSGVEGTIDYLTGKWTLFSTRTGTDVSGNTVFEPLEAGLSLDVTYTLHDGIPDDGEMLMAVMGAKVANLISRLPEGDLKEKMEAILEDLLGNTFIPTLEEPHFSWRTFIKDFREGAVNEYQRNLDRAVVAAQSLNDTEKEELRRRFFEFEEFYKSASAMMAKITQILEKIAQNISR